MNLGKDTYVISDKTRLIEYLSNLGYKLEDKNGVTFVSNGKDVIARIYQMNSNPENPNNGRNTTYFSFFTVANMHTSIKEEIVKYLKQNLFKTQI
ncbi:MAG: hypothetical protein N3D75_04220 [Candidatus Aenigmarchaeota archaeon]|nr:hypothetical protein [Candidatus Aenigmarchaeota archaeon]